MLLAARINQRGVFVLVDADGGSLHRQSAEDILYPSGGHSSSRLKADAAMYSSFQQEGLLIVWAYLSDIGPLSLNVRELGSSTACRM